MDDTTDLLQIKIEKAKAQLPEDTLNAINAVDWQAAIFKMRETKGYSFEQLGDLEIETELVLCGLLAPENYPQELENRMKITKTQANELVNDMNIQVFSKIKEELIKNTERKNALAKNQKNDSQILSKAGIKIIPVPTLGENKEKITENIEGVMDSAGIQIIPARNASSIANAGEPANNAGEEKFKKDMHSIFAQKLSAPVQNPIVKTEHTLDNLTKTPSAPTSIPQVPTAPSNIMGNIKPASASTSKLSPSYSKGEDPYRIKPE